MPLNAREGLCLPIHAMCVAALIFGVPWFFKSSVEMKGMKHLKGGDNPAFQAAMARAAFTSITQAQGRHQRCYGDYCRIVLLGDDFHGDVADSHRPSWVRDLNDGTNCLEMTDIALECDGAMQFWQAPPLAARVAADRGLSLSYKCITASVDYTSILCNSLTYILIHAYWCLCLCPALARAWSSPQPVPGISCLHTLKPIVSLFKCDFR